MSTQAAQAGAFGLFERMVAGRYLRSRRQDGWVAFVAIISFVGIMAGVAFLIITMSVMNGFRETLLSRILGVEAHVFVQMEDRAPGELGQILAAARALPDVVSAAPVVEGQVLASANGVSTGALVRGIRREDLLNVPLVAGSLLDGASLDALGTDEEGVTGVLVGYRIAAQLGLRAGDPITLLSPSGAATPFGVVPRRKTYRVAAEFNVGMAEADGVYIYAPLEEAQLFFGRGEGVDRIDIRLREPDDAADVIGALRAALPPDAYVFDWKASRDALAGALDIERNVMRLILMIVISLAALNIVTGLAMLVKNKSRDIAILRTMGATRGAILRIFMLAGVAVGVSGMIAGLILGVGFCLAIGPIQDFVSFVIGRDIFPGEVYSLDQLPAKIEWGEVALVSLWSLAMSVVATFLPAWFGSRLEPVEALRYE